MTTRPPSHTSKPSIRPLRSPGRASPRANRSAQEAHRNKRGSTLVSLTSRGLTPCPNQTTIDPSPNRRPLGRQLCLPISPTCRKTRAPSCSRLPTLPRPQARLRARRLLRPTRSGASGLKSGERDGSYRDRDRKWPLLDTLPTEWERRSAATNRPPSRTTTGSPIKKPCGEYGLDRGASIWRALGRAH
jgi:hypothetical protein